MPEATADDATLANPFADTYDLLEELPWGDDEVQYFRARHTDEDRQVVLALLPEAASDGAPASSLALLGGHLESIDEPTLLRITDSGMADGRIYFEHEDLDAVPLSALLGEPMPSLRLLKIGDQVLRSMVALHLNDMLHGNLHPGNVLVVEGGKPHKPVVRVIGAGIAPILRSGGVWQPDEPTVIDFDGAYQPPEIVAGDRATKRTDFFAGGVMLYHMTIGRPFEAGAAFDEGFEDIPQLPDVIRRATASDPAERYADAAAMLAALDWLDVVSSKMNPHTQDIPLWMEHSVVGNIPVTALNAASGEFSAPPPGMLEGSYAPPRRTSSRYPSAPPVQVPPGAASIPSIPQAAALPRRDGRPRGQDNSLWWLAAALCLVIILMAMGWAWLSTSRREPPQQAPAPDAAALPAPGAAPPTPAPAGG